MRPSQPDDLKRLTANSFSFSLFSPPYLHRIFGKGFSERERGDRKKSIPVYRDYPRFEEEEKSLPQKWGRDANKARRIWLDCLCGREKKMSALDSFLFRLLEKKGTKNSFNRKCHIFFLWKAFFVYHLAALNVSWQRTRSLAPSARRITAGSGSVPW